VTSATVDMDKPIGFRFGRPPRAAYFAGIQRALERGDWASLPVLPGVPEDDRCGECRGTGYVFRRSTGRPLRVCWCCRPGPHPGFDLDRSARPANAVVTRLEYPDGEPWGRRACGGCSIGLVDSGSLIAWAQVRGRATLPWWPECRQCCDTGWTELERLADSDAWFRYGALDPIG
jgi:hypothetical protein